MRVADGYGSAGLGYQRLVTAPDWVDGFVDDARAAGEDIPESLRLARTYGALLPLPGRGRTKYRWDVLAQLGGANLTVGRVYEAHTDAIAILNEAGAGNDVDPDATYGVFAAEGPGEPVHAVAADPIRGPFLLSGTKSWCSLGSELDIGLVTAHVDGGRRLFRVDLQDATVTAQPTSGWVARGLRTITSTSLQFDATPAVPVGDVDWYLRRPGFSWGGVGVAACWYGGARALQARLLRAAKQPPDPLWALHAGEIDAALYAALHVLAHSAAAIDDGNATGRAGELLALRTRAVVADAAEKTLRAVAHALGPAPLAFEEEHVRRVADLELYLRQHHAERDLAALGQAAIGTSVTGLDL